MKHRTTYKTLCLILIFTVFHSIVYGQEITLMDFGLNQPTRTTPGNWNNVTNSSTLNSTTDLIDNSGIITGEILTLTDPFDDDINGWGTTAPSTSLPFPSSATRDNFFGEATQFTDATTSLEPTGGFTLSGLEIGKYYSFTIFASRTGVTDNRETLYTITGNAGVQTATLDAANNTSNVVTMLDVQPNSSGVITIQATTGPNNTNSYGFYYLGAIEMTKTSCPYSSVTWNGSAWSNGSVPDLFTQAIIAGPYNTATNGNFSACSLTVNSGARLIVNNSTYVEVENDVVVDGELWVETQGNFVQNNDDGTFVVNIGGDSRVIKETAAKAQWYHYTYWSSPVSGLTIANAFPDVDGDRRFWFNAANYIDINGDNIDDNGNDWQYALGGVIMQPGVGYAATASRFHFPGGTDSATFIGPFNTGDISPGIVNNPLNTAGSWNLIGNPYPSAIDFIAFQQANSSVVDGAAYFWSQATPPDGANPGNQKLNFSQNDYAVFTVGSGGTKVDANGDMPNGYIPSGQSFFIAGLTTEDATFTNAMRMADESSNSQFFKNSNSKSGVVENKLWVNLTSDNGVFNQILTAYVDGATNGDDGLSYDAPRLSGKKFMATLYSIMENSTKKFAIQGKATHSLDAHETIKLGFATNIDVATLYTLSIAQFQGEFLTNNTIYLKDNLLNKVHNLSEADYTFTSEVGEFNERFVVMFSNQTLSTDKLVADANTLKIIDLDSDRVKFTTNNDLTIKTVSVFDLLGRELYTFKGQNSEEIYHLSSLKNAVYIAKVELSNGTIITKKAIKK